jgi:prepilin-type N-terminal cleavage/methylation domain-containing protein
MIITLNRRHRRRRGWTLPELIVVVALIAVVCGFVLPPLKRGFDRIATRAAAREVMMACFSARAQAISLGVRIAVLLDAKTGRVVVVSGRDTLLMRPIGTSHGVTMIATRDSMTYFPDGLGLGGANLSVILRRGSAVDTVLVSREGRVKLGARAR